VHATNGLGVNSYKSEIILFVNPYLCNIPPSTIYINKQWQCQLYANIAGIAIALLVTLLHKSHYW